MCIELTYERYSELKEYIYEQQHVLVLGPPEASERNLAPIIRHIIK
jgi:hypothetical protein